MSQDSLINDEEENNNNKNTQSSSPTTTNNSKTNGKLKSSINLDEHIKIVKQKKEEADVLRLQKFQEQLRKKEQKW
jgi:hypothetical protein